MPTTFARSTTCAAFAAMLAACGPEPAPPAPVDSTGASDIATPPAPPSPRALGPNEFADRIAQLPAGGNCALDVLNGQPFPMAATVARTDEVTAGGWVANAQGGVPTDARFVMEGAARSYAFPVAVGVIREDVARVLNNEALKLAGYGVSLPVSEVEVGTYNLAIVMGGPEPHVCAYTQTLTVAD